MSTSQIKKSGSDMDMKEIKTEIQSLDDDDVVFIFLEAKDGKKFKINKKLAIISGLIKTALGDDGDQTDEIVPLPSVDSDTLNLIVKLMKIANGADVKVIEKPFKDKIYLNNIDSKTDPTGYLVATLIDPLNKTQLFDLISALNYMDIKNMLHNACAKVASMIKGQPIDKIKEILNPALPSETEGKKEAKSMDVSLE